MMTRSL